MLALNPTKAIQIKIFKEEINMVDRLGGVGSVERKVFDKSNFNLHIILGELDKALQEGRLFLEAQSLVGMSCTAGKPDPETGLIPLMNPRHDSIYGKLAVSDEPHNHEKVADENVYDFEFHRGEGGNPPEIKVFSQRYVFVDENKYANLRRGFINHLGG